MALHEKGPCDLCRPEIRTMTTGNQRGRDSSCRVRVLGRVSLVIWMGPRKGSHWLNQQAQMDGVWPGTSTFLTQVRSAVICLSGEAPPTSSPHSRLRPGHFWTESTFSLFWRLSEKLPFIVCLSVCLSISLPPTHTLWHHISKVI